MNDQTYHVEAVKTLMESLKDQFFSHVTSNFGIIVDSVMQHCVLDRVLLSPIDAVYCTQYAVLLNTLEVRTYTSSVLFIIPYFLIFLLSYLFTLICFL